MKSLLFTVVVLALPVLVGAAATAPAPTHPLEKDSPLWKGQIRFEWESTNSPYYRYSIDLPTGEQRFDTVAATSSTLADLNIAEGYRWRVASCDDRGGSDCGPVSSTHTFSVVAAPKEAVGGIVPCNRLYDDIYTTPNINEASPCGFPHFFLLIKNVLDFLLWQAGPLVILVMAVFTGFFTYFSLGRPDIGARIKSTWRSVFAGYLVALLAWGAVTVLLRLFGFQAALFGNWWELTF